MLPVHRLHYLPNAHRHAVVIKLRPSLHRIWRKRAVQPALVADVVIRLLNRRSVEVWPRDKSTARYMHFKKHVRLRRTWRIGSSHALDRPLLSFRSHKPRLSQSQLARRRPWLSTGYMQPNVEINARGGV